MPSTPPQLPCEIPASPAEMRRRIGKSSEVVRGVVTSSRVIDSGPSGDRRRDTEFRFKVGEVMTGGLHAGTEVLITAIGSVQALLPVDVEHVVFLMPTQSREGHERYGVVGGPLGRFALMESVCRLECFRRGEVVEVAEMARDRFEEILSAATQPGFPTLPVT